MRHWLVITLIAFSSAAKSEQCQTIPDIKTVKCPAATITLEGEKYPDKAECSNGALKNRSAFYVNSRGMHLELPSVKSLYSKDKQFIQSEYWVPSDDVQCQGSNKVLINYGNGGNCVGCEQFIQYTFNPIGELKETHLVDSIDPDEATSQRVWLSSACYKARLSASDKFSNNPFKAKYTVTSSKGRIFVAERDATDSTSAEVVFPDDFHDEKISGINASVDCFHGDKYTWKIYANDKLIDSGTIGFTRNK